MQFVIYRAIGFLCIIALGTKLKGYLHLRTDTCDVWSWVMMHITLPCVILITMNAKTFPLELLIFIPMGIVSNLLLLSSCFLLYRNHKERAYHMVSISGFNIGCFALPLINGLFSSSVVLALCMFDLGNAIMCLGMNADLANLGNGETLSIKKLFHNTMHSIPIWAYLSMLTLCLFHIQLPQVIVPLIQTAADANPFLAMMSIGFAMRIHIHSQDIYIIVVGVCHRLCVCLMLGCCLFLLPYPEELRHMLILLVLSPISAAAPAYVQKLHMDYEMSASMNSIYMLISIFLICGYIMMFL